MKKIVLALLMISMLTMVSCTKEPTACATADKSKVMIGESVSFSSCATDAKSVAWDFGDGSKGDGASATHSYTTAGTYLVTMTAKSKNDKKTDRFSLVVNVKDNPKDRFITKVVFKAFPATPPQGGTWDTTQTGFPIPLPGNNPEPDINMTIRTTDNSWSSSIGTWTDLGQNTLPITSNYAQQWIRVTDQDYQLVLVDQDFSVGLSLPPTINNFNTPMKAFTFNPKTAGTNGVIELNDGGYRIDIYYEER